MGIIDIKNVSFKYIGTKSPVLRDVSLEIQKGEFITIVGHNGSGKSTLAKHMNGLLVPTSGDVLVNGMNTKEDELSLNIKKTVGMVFQNPDNQIVTTVVEDDIAFGPENLGVPSAEIRTRVDEALEAVGMTKYAKSAPHMLSGGQKQRIAIAGMLAMRPEVLVFDEATAMLDPLGRNEVLNIVRTLNKEQGITIIMITQYMEEATLADRIVVMSDGEIVMVDNPRRVFAQSARLKSIGLNVPFAVNLRNKLISNGLKPNNAITVEEISDVLYDELVLRGSC